MLASGQAASTFAILNIAQAGDHFVALSSIYGGTYNLFKYTLAKLGIEVTFVENQDDAEEWRRAVRPNTKPVLRGDHSATRRSTSSTSAPSPTSHTSPASR